MDLITSQQSPEMERIISRTKASNVSLDFKSCCLRSSNSTKQSRYITFLISSSVWYYVWEVPLCYKNVLSFFHFLKCLNSKENIHSSADNVNIVEWPSSKNINSNKEPKVQFCEAHFSNTTDIIKSSTEWKSKQKGINFWIGFL